MVCASWLGIRVVALALLCISMITGPLAITPAQANNKYASVVMDHDTGEVFYARSSEQRRYPASLTKVMTLYMLFEELSQGRFTLNTRLRASARAARQPPSKLGIKSGETITVRDAIRALVIRSGNDVAVVVAEAIAGSESRFAQRMTQRARQLGMRRTTFRNASGLPNRRQVTTARDMALMAQRIAKDFPQYMHFFEETRFTWNGRTWHTHNHVVKNLDGADGMKTGYTRASGFNLITTAERNGVRLIGVVMGGRTAKRRDRDMARIMNLTYRRIANNRSYQRRLMAGIVRPVARPGGSAVAAATPDVPRRGTQVAAAAPSSLPLRKPDILAIGAGLDAANPAVVAKAAVSPAPRPASLSADSAPDEPAVIASLPTPRPDFEAPAAPVPAPTAPVSTTDATVETVAARAAPDLVERGLAPVPLSERTDLPESTAPDTPLTAEAPDETASRILTALRTNATPERGDEAGARRTASTDFAVASLETQAAERSRATGRSVVLPFRSDGLGTDVSGEMIGEGDADGVDYSMLMESGPASMGVQVGAFLRLTTATRYINNAMLLAPEVLDRTKAAIVPTETPSGRIFRARFGPFSESDANTACGLLEAKGMDCFPIEESNWSGAIRP